ncbi:MAG: hypothetical protein Q7V63_05320 [Gammaproteobacteria bacterium]|nr:hypothetical protein [Gammaproteobacteria bacterium]
MLLTELKARIELYNHRKGPFRRAFWDAPQIPFLKKYLAYTTDNLVYKGENPNLSMDDFLKHYKCEALFTKEYLESGTQSALLFNAWLKSDGIEAAKSPFNPWKHRSLEDSLKNVAESINQPKWE